MLTLIHTGLLLDSDAELTPPSLAIRHQWTVIAAGCFASALVSWLLAPVSQLLQPSPFVILAASCLFVALAVSGGYLGAWIAQLALTTPLPCDAARISRQAFAAWLFFPSIALFSQQRSPLVFLSAAIAAITLTLGLRPLFTQADEPQPTPRTILPLPSLNGLPASDANFQQAAFIAICAVGALACASNRYLFSAVLLLAVSISLPLWRWSAFSSAPADTLGKPGIRYPLAALAIVLTILSLTPSSFADGLWPFKGTAHHSLYAAHSPGSYKGVDRDYVSIILLPPPVKKTRVIPPPPSSGPGSATAKSVVIPFSGAYWYFQLPAVGPGAQAHQAHGTPTAVDIRSTSPHPLAMEAHQKLDLPIDLSCCRAIDLAITNADTRPLPIALRIQLQNISDKQTFDLGKITIPSSTGPIRLNRQPVRETLRFIIPPSPLLHRFDRITVIYLPSGIRSHVGAKVSIDSFTLVPR